MGITGAKIAVVGGGITGLATAYREKRNGSDVTLFEASSCVGGKIDTLYSEGFELDLGPVTFSETPELARLIADLGLDVIEASDASKIRYIYWKNSLRRPKATLRMMAAPFIAPMKEHETVATYARRRFGTKAYQKLFNPMMNGIYAGDSELLSAHWCLSKKRGPRKILSLKGGLTTLTKGIAGRLGSSVKTNTPVHDLDDLKDFDRIYIATPAFAAAKLLPGLSDDLNKIHYSSVTQIYCEVVPGEIGFDGFGFLVPSEERMSLLGAVCVSNVFPSKAPEGKMLFVLFCGGDRPYDFKATTKDALAEFNLILRPAFNKVLHVREWNRAIPQFYVGHEKIVAKIRSYNPRIVVKGNYISGVAVGDCV